MGVTTRLVVGGLNVTVSPHPEGVYRELIEVSADKEIFVGGSDYAKITPPQPVTGDPNRIHGRICVWADIDKSGDWFNKKTNEKATTKDKDGVIIPRDIAPNARFFYYAVDLKKHIIIYEQRNEMRQTFSTRRAFNFFQELFLRANDLFLDFSLTTIPETNSLQRILALPKLSHLKIVVTKPNPDDMTDEILVVMNKLGGQKARSLTLELQKAAKVDRLYA